MFRLLKTYEEWAEAGILKTPRLVLHKEKGRGFEDIRLEDFEMVDYSPIKPQLTFELGI